MTSVQLTLAPQFITTLVTRVELAIFNSQVQVETLISLLSIVWAVPLLDVLVHFHQESKLAPPHLLCSQSALPYHQYPAYVVAFTVPT